jgi:hypothetical protein
MKDAQGHGSNPRGSREEQIAIRQGIDARHFPTRTPQDYAAAQALGQGHPKSAPVPLGQSFQAAKDALARGRTVALPPGAESRRTEHLNSQGHAWGSPAALSDFKAKYGGPRDHAAEQRGFNSGAREIARLRRQGK